MISYFRRYGLKLPADNQQSARVVGIGTAIVWILLLIMVVLVPIAKSAWEIHTRLQVATQQSSVLTENLARVDMIREQLQVQAAFQSQVGSAVPETPRVVTLLNELELAVAVKNLVLEDLSYDSAAGATPANILRFNLHVRGGYPDIRALVEHLESHPRLIKLEQVSISRLDRREEERLSVASTGSGGSLRAIIAGGAYTSADNMGVTDGN